MLYCPNKTKKTIFLSLPRASAKKIGFIGTVQHFLPLGFKKCCTVPIKPIFLADALGRLKKIVFLVLLGQHSTFHQKDWFYWDSTALFKAQRQKVLYCPNKTNLFGRCSWKTQKDCFFGFIWTVQHFSPRRLVLLGQYSTFCLWALKSAVLSQ